MVDINKNILSQIELYSATISMPKGYEIDKDTLQTDLFNKIKLSFLIKFYL